MNCHKSLDLNGFFIKLRHKEGSYRDKNDKYGRIKHEKISKKNTYLFFILGCRLTFDKTNSVGSVVSNKKILLFNTY